jgi:hypothetical protein
MSLTLPSFLTFQKCARAVQSFRIACAQRATMAKTSAVVVGLQVAMAMVENGRGDFWRLLDVAV